MDIRQLQYLVALAREKHFTRARNTAGRLTGHLSVGVIPSALPMMAVMTKSIQARHPGVELTILSQSSIEILRNLEDFAIDIGLTYLDNEPIEGMRCRAAHRPAH